MVGSVILPIHNMAARHPGLTPALAEAYLDAGRVCLDRHHTSPTEFHLEEAGSASRATVQWQPADARCQAAYANDIDTTEMGGYLVALATAEATKGLVAVSRAETRTGADYYLSPMGIAVEDLEAAFRLEVSGTDKGDRSTVARRLREKVDQALDGHSSVPAIAIVVGFQSQLVMIEQVDAQ